MRMSEEEFIAKTEEALRQISHRRTMMQKAKERTRREAEKDKRPSSLLAYEGIHTLSNGVKVEFTNTNRID